MLARLAEGLTNRATAEALGLSAKTVNRHVENIFNKMGVSTRAAAVAKAVKAGLSVTCHGANAPTPAAFRMGCAHDAGLGVRGGSFLRFRKEEVMLRQSVHLERDRRPIRAELAADLFEAGAAFRSHSETTRGQPPSPRGRVLCGAPGSRGPRSGGDRRRSGRDFRRLSPAAPGHRIRDPRWRASHRRDWRGRWDSLRPFHPGQVRHARRLAVSGRRRRLPDQGRDGRLSRSLCRQVPAAGSPERRVERLGRERGCFVVETGRRRYMAHQVVVAAASYKRRASRDSQGS